MVNNVEYGKMISVRPSVCRCYIVALVDVMAKTFSSVYFKVNVVCATMDVMFTNIKVVRVVCFNYFAICVEGVAIPFYNTGQGYNFDFSPL